MRLRGAAKLGLIALGVASCVPVLAGPPPDLAASIEERLDWARLAAESPQGDCTQRLDGVQKTLDEVSANPALDILTPSGAARLADIGYRLHIGRAYCGQTTPNKEELHAALESALRAVALYRDLHDYQSMTVMQYDAALTHRLLGDEEKAVSALREALRLDGEYGFAADSAENADVLAGWTGQPADRPVVTPRAITLKFAWNEAVADVVTEVDYLDLAGKVLRHSKASGAAERKIGANGGNWILSAEPGERHYQIADYGEGESPRKQVAATLAAQRMLAPGLKISSKGAFEKAIDPEMASATLVGDIETLAGRLPPEKEAEALLEPTALMGLSAQLLTRPNGVAFKAEQDYDIAISAWIDATLDQGEWYDMQASLLLPGMAVLMDHDIQFSYAGPVPCGRAECAEILVHATPNPEALGRWLKAMRGPFKLSGAEVAHYSSATDLRLVLDPDHLLPYLVEARGHWYFALDGRGEPMIGSEKSVSTYHYRDGQTSSTLAN